MKSKLAENVKQIMICFVAFKTKKISYYGTKSHDLLLVNKWFKCLA